LKQTLKTELESIVNQRVGRAAGGVLCADFALATPPVYEFDK
jgi:hypothetical protein